MAVLKKHWKMFGQFREILSCYNGYTLKTDFPVYYQDY